ncbi:MAG TPA: sterol desaturase family protein [Pseudolabrys sp.]|nr:sterol desaturase family protein [Pseudolabrys sp.]
MDLIWNGLVRNFNHLCDVLFSAGSQFSLTSLGCALAIAAGFLIHQRWRRKRRIRLRTLMRALFPRRILRSPSTVADVGYFLFNVFVYAGIFGMAAISYQFITNWIIGGLVSAFGQPKPLLPEFVSRSIITVMLFLAYELGYWIDHYLKHRVPVLWELHKVHHTAEVLTPLTSFRMHPFDTWIFGNILAVTAAVANGVGAYAFGDTAYQYALSGTNIILVVFIHIYVHLQHTHMWIAFRGALGRIFISPAHHQVHHSTNPIHFNKNLGSCLAVWDWLFGTLHIPSKEREQLHFGVEPAYADAHTITGEFLSPIGRAFTSMVAVVTRRAPPWLTTPASGGEGV